MRSPCIFTRLPAFVLGLCVLALYTVLGGAAWAAAEPVEMFLDAPLVARAAATSVGSVLVFWRPMPNAIGYRVERSVEGSGMWSYGQFVPAPASEFTDGSVEPGATYRYRVSAYNGVGHSVPVLTESVPTVGRDGLAGAPVSGGANLDLWRSGTVWAAARQGDGKIVIGGTFTRVNGVATGNLARLSSSGFLDGGFSLKRSFEGAIRAIAIQPDGRILVGGSFVDAQGQVSSGVVRLTSTGSLDPSFGALGRPGGDVHCLALLADGKVLVGGVFNWGLVARSNLARLNADGTVDESFLAQGGGTNGPVYALAPQADGRCFVGGDFSQFNGAARRRLMRIEATGTLDETFSGALVFDAAVRCLSLAADKGVFVGGDSVVIGRDDAGKAAARRIDLDA